MSAERHGYRYYDDDRRFTSESMAPESSFAPTINRYELWNGEEFWFDPDRSRIETTIPGTFLEYYAMTVERGVRHYLVIEIDGRRLQVAGRDGEGISSALVRQEDETLIWTIGSIGAPLDVYTGYDDDRRHIHRPLKERRQRLTNASGFSDAKQQETAVAFVKRALSAYGNLRTGDMVYGREVSGRVILDTSLEAEIGQGGLIDA